MTLGRKMARQTVAMIIVFIIQVLNSVSVSRSRMCCSVGATKDAYRRRASHAERVEDAGGAARRLSTHQR